MEQDKKLLEIGKKLNLATFFTVFNDINASPPSYYERSPVHHTTNDEPVRPHVYETPDDDQVDPLPAKERLPEDAVVYMIPEKQDKSLEAGSFSKQTAVSNAYEEPDIRSLQRTTGAQPQFR